MITLTENAVKRIQFFLQDRDPKQWGIRIRSQGPHAFSFALEELSSVSPLDVVVPSGDFQIMFADTLKSIMKEAAIDYVETEWNRGFKVTFPEEKTPATDFVLDRSDPRVEKIEHLLKDEINPAIASHGGFAQLLGIKDNQVYLKMGGGCQGCASSQATLRNGIEMRIKEEVPDIIGIIDQTDHSSGANPYYR